MTTNAQPLDLESKFVVMHPDLSATTVDVTPTVFEELNRRFDNFRGRWLFSTFAFDKDWATREMHPAGDEIVFLLSGSVELILERSDGRQSVRLSAPGAYVIIPKGTWHTARASTPTRMLFITPGEGTRNEPA